MTCTMSPSQGSSQDLKPDSETAERMHTCTCGTQAIGKRTFNKTVSSLRPGWSVSTGRQSRTPFGPEGLLCARHFHIKFHVSLTRPASHLVLIPSLSPLVGG